MGKGVESLGSIVCLVIISLVGITAGSAHAQKFASPHLKVRPPAKSLDGYFHENAVEVSVASGSFFDIKGSDNEYHIVPVLLSVGWQLDEVGNSGWTRGNTEFHFTGYFNPVVNGHESRVTGAIFGPRYNFVQPGSKWAPFIGARVGFGFWDSVDNTDLQSQGQDFTFTFAVEAGTRYIINDNMSFSAALMYQHWSNGGLSEPEQINYGADLLGPVMSLNYKF